MRLSIFLALLAATCSPALAQTHDLSSADRTAVSAVTSAYFDALAAGDGPKLNALTASGYQAIDTRGAVSTLADVIGTAIRAELEGTLPQGRLTTSAAIARSNTAIEEATWQTYRYSFVAGRELVIRRYSHHFLTLVPGEGGTWRILTDRSSIDNTSL